MGSGTQSTFPLFPNALGTEVLREGKFSIPTKARPWLLHVVRATCTASGVPLARGARPGILLLDSSKPNYLDTSEVLHSFADYALILPQQ